MYGASKTATRQEREGEREGEQRKCGNVATSNCENATPNILYKKSFTRNLLSWLVKMTKYVHIHLLRNCCYFLNLDSPLPSRPPSLGIGQPNQA